MNRDFYRSWITVDGRLREVRLPRPAIYDDGPPTIPVEPRNEREAHAELARSPSLAQQMVEDDRDVPRSHVWATVAVVLAVACAAGWAALSGLTL